MLDKYAPKPRPEEYTAWKETHAPGGCNTLFSRFFRCQFFVLACFPRLLGYFCFEPELCADLNRVAVRKFNQKAFQKVSAGIPNTDTKREGDSKWLTIHIVGHAASKAKPAKSTTTKKQSPYYLNKIFHFNLLVCLEKSAGGILLSLV
jgi:hypothetical protein